jgi:hypothetical protein
MESIVMMAPMVEMLNYIGRLCVGNQTKYTHNSRPDLVSTARLSLDPTGPGTPPSSRLLAVTTTLMHRQRWFILLDLDNSSIEDNLSAR